MAQKRNCVRLPAEISSHHERASSNGRAGKDGFVNFHVKEKGKKTRFDPFALFSTNKSATTKYGAVCCVVSCFSPIQKRHNFQVSTV